MYVRLPWLRKDVVPEQRSGDGRCRVGQPPGTEMMVTATQWTGDDGGGKVRVIGCRAILNDGGGGGGGRRRRR